MGIHENEMASEVVVTKRITITHGEDTSTEEILDEAIHRLQTGRGTIEDTRVERQDEEPDP